MQDNAPSTISGVITWGLGIPMTALKIALSVYNGEVPISPYTIPRLTSNPPAVTVFKFF